MEIKSYIEELFSYLDKYENSYAQFETEAFFQTYNGIIAVFNPLRQQRGDAMEVDGYFLDRIRQAPLTSSDLRQLTVQVLITYFESEADTDGQSNRAYSYCRGLRAVKQDVPYFENHLVPLLFDEGGLNANQRLRAFLLSEIARYVNKFGRRSHAGVTPEEFQSMSDPLKMLELEQRRLMLGSDLVKDRTTLEFHLQRIDYFNKLGARAKMYDQFLRDWGYLKTTSFWSRIRAVMSTVGGKIRGAFSSFGYFRLMMTQRNPAYLFYGLLIVIFIFLAIYVPIKWQNYGNSRLEQMQNHAQELTTGNRGK